jgi:RNA polymerase-binding transcription factor DksA
MRPNKQEGRVLEMQNFNEFIAWERVSQDTIDFKKIYADIAEDTLGGLVLSQIIYWHIPNKQGLSKLRIKKEGKIWMACNRAEWWEKTRLSPRQIDRVLGILETKNIILKRVFRFNGTPIIHIHLNVEVFVLLMNHLVANPPENPYQGEMDFTNSLNRNLPNGEMEIDETVESLTKTVTKNTKREKIPASQGDEEKSSKELLLEEMTALVKKELKQYGAIATKIAKLTLGFCEGKDAELNLEAPMSPEDFNAFLVDWEKKKDREGNKLARPSNLGSFRRNVLIWQESRKSASPSNQREQTWGYVPDFTVHAEGEGSS